MISLEPIKTLKNKESKDWWNETSDEEKNQLKKD